jgi:hypothetical protein
MNGRESVIHGDLPLRMIINDLDVSCLVVNPLETDTPLVVDADGILVGSITFELLEPITRRGEQVLEVLSVIKIDQFPASRALDVLW